MTTQMLVAALLFLSSITVGQQQSRHPNPCQSSESREFDFMLGDWQGVERAVTDGKEMSISSTSKIQVKKVLGDCAIQEDWEVEHDGKRLFSAKLLRSYDTASRKWLLTYVDDQLNHQSYEGRKESGQWRFLRERLAEGKPILVRITWVSTGENKFEQTIERSEDNGKTWKVRALINYVRKGQ